MVSEPITKLNFFSNSKLGKFWGGKGLQNMNRKMKWFYEKGKCFPNLSFFLRKIVIKVKSVNITKISTQLKRRHNDFYCNFFLTNCNKIYNFFSVGIFLYFKAKTMETHCILVLKAYCFTCTQSVFCYPETITFYFT